MRVLFVVASNLKNNNSANLCHVAYIKGFVENGHEVVVVSKSEKIDTVDESIILPSGAKYITFDSSILYKMMGSKKRDEYREEIENKDINKDPSIKVKIFKTVREMVKKMYGPFGFNSVWINKVAHNFKDSSPFDLVISLSSPVEGHVAAIKLIKNRNITTKCFCEIWEDPWQLDIYQMSRKNNSVNNRMIKLEEKIVESADHVIYVSPITLKYQQKVFSRSASKMSWITLPSYYSSDNTKNSINEDVFGYFGTYLPTARNLEPFYTAACEADIRVFICGQPSKLFAPTEKIHIYDRMPLDKLRKVENKTNNLVFLCNLKGGQIPGKIYQYAATDKKILFILDGTKNEQKILYDFFVKYNRFYFCKNNKEDIIRTIDFMKNDNTVSNKPLDCFSPKTIADRVVDIIYGKE